MSTSPTTVEGAIVSVLQNNAAVAAIIATRIAPLTDPQSVPRPKLTYNRWGTSRDSDIGGFTNDGPTGLAVAKIFIDAWSDDMLTAKQLASAVRDALNGFSGIVGSVSIDTAYIQDERETPGGLIPGTEKPVQRITLDFRVMFTDQ